MGNPLIVSSKNGGTMHVLLFLVLTEDILVSLLFCKLGNFHDGLIFAKLGNANFTKLKQCLSQNVHC